VVQSLPEVASVPAEFLAKNHLNIGGFENMHPKQVFVPHPEAALEVPEVGLVFYYPGHRPELGQ
jgi:hypothetical protein